MLLSHLSLQNFRNYTKKEFSFNAGVTVIIGPNTAGKSNLIEAIFYIATGKSFRAEKDVQLIQFTAPFTRITGIGKENGEQTMLEARITNTILSTVAEEQRMFAVSKRYFVNGVAKRRVDFEGRLQALLFTPTDLEIISDGPSYRRAFLDDVLEQIDIVYRRSLLLYTKAIRQRNALLEKVQETGLRSEREFSYWDDLLIQNGQIIAKKREAFIAYMNDTKKDIIPCSLFYDCSTISQERLLQYKDAEVGAGVTLVGPHRDDFRILMEETEGTKETNETQGPVDMKAFGSRGQQRLAVLQLKLLQLSYMEEQSGKRPLLLLDDIFSELDEEHIHLVMDILPLQQTILTTTHKEFVSAKDRKTMDVIELEK